MTDVSHRRDIGPAENSASLQANSSAFYLLPVIFLSALYTVGLSFLTIRRLGAPEFASLLYPLTFSLLLTGWVRADRRIRGLRVPFEFEVFVYFAWPLFVPYYLVRTRGRIGLLFGAGIWAIFTSPYVVATILYVVSSR